MIEKFRLQRTLWLVVLAIACPAALADRIPTHESAQRPVDLVIALDVSGSMSGLIESAKQRLWDVVNELAQASPAPDLRIAVLTYGNPSYGAQSGYVSVDQPLTRDLDAVMRTLFGFGTNGGDEYVARVISTAVSSLEWSEDPEALKIVFVAGNEAADQDPLIGILQATQSASAKGIVVNTIYCGSENDSIVAGWRNVASLAKGVFASIDQNAAAVARIETPMDQRLLELNQELNETYVAFGEKGDRFRTNQAAQDENSLQMSPASAASRAVAKAGKLYRNEDWDLVDARRAGMEVESLDAASLPEPMRDMTQDERREFVDELETKRETIAAEIEELGRQRDAFIAEEQSRRRKDAGAGLDEAVLGGLRSLAEEKGFRFE